MTSILYDITNFCMKSHF